MKGYSQFWQLGKEDPPLNPMEKRTPIYLFFSTLFLLLLLLPFSIFNYGAHVLTSSRHFNNRPIYPNDKTIQTRGVLSFLIGGIGGGTFPISRNFEYLLYRFAICHLDSILLDLVLIHVLQHLLFVEGAADWQRRSV